MTTVRKTIRILVEGQPETYFLEERIIKKYKTYFPHTDLEVKPLGTKSTLLSLEQLTRHYFMLKNDPNLICFFLPDFHPTNCLSLDHTDLESLRRDLYGIIERKHPTINIPNYRERFLIHTFKQGGEVIFLANLNIVFRELEINDEDFINEIKSRCNLDNLEDFEQNSKEESYEKLILKEIFNKAGISYTVKNYESIIKNLNFKNLINHLAHFKAFLSDLFKFAEQNQETFDFKERYDL
ncbi:hypothetical protein LCGC14_0555820 [marine sediment metagenome]|uniref:DUF4276 family protein n=1 Tax=marine sediment metagenome TaxID=412755 RepID=A0A0F9U9U4_9ZZZZ|nr:hypothetical protein [archaeon]